MITNIPSFWVPALVDTMAGMCYRLFGKAELYALL